MEENVKLNVKNLADALVCYAICFNDPFLMSFQSHSPSERKNPLQIYGFVYGKKISTPKGMNLTNAVIDVDTGALKDLDVTVTVDFTHHD